MFPSHLAADPLINLQHSVTATTVDELIPYIRSHFETLMTDTGDWNLSIYDLAWVLCCDFFSSREQEHHLCRLIDAQNPDGTWGDATYLPHSALVDTLAVLMVLTRFNCFIPNFDLLQDHLSELIIACRDYTHHDTVAFELITPKLVYWLQDHRIELNLTAEAAQFIVSLQQISDQKLDLLRQTTGLFSAALTLSYTMEFATFIPLQDDEIDQLTRVILPNGAIGLSPSATAAVIMILSEHNRPVPAALYDYLRQTFADYHQTGFPDLHPIVTSRRLWNVRPWLISGNFFLVTRDQTLLDVFTKMYQEISIDSKGRVAWDTNNYQLPDLDDTAVTIAFYAALACAGASDLQPIMLDGLKHFRRKDGSFFCYPYELHPSPAALLHTIMGLHLTSLAFGYGDQEIYSSLLCQINPAGKSLDDISRDKWHSTWTYGAQLWFSLMSLHERYPDKVREILYEVLDREENGGWGEKSPTIEETAYIVSGLSTLLFSPALRLSKEERTRIRRVLQRSWEFLKAELTKDTLHVPPLWISKNMYAPRFQVASAVFDALFCLVNLRL